MACVITFNNKKYNYEEFASMLVSGELDKMIGEGLIDKSKLTGDMSVLSKGETKKGISSSRSTALKDVESTTKALEGVDGDSLNKAKSNFIITKAEEISKKSEYLNCDAFCHRLVNNRLFKDVFDKVDFNIKFGGKTEKVVSELQKILKVGDIIAFGDKNDARHYAVYLGDDSVYEVEGWGEKPRKYSLSKNIDTYTGLNNIYRDNELNKEISEAYHKAKEDGGNPELVNAVEELLGDSSAGKGISSSRKVINWEVSPEGKGDPSISARNPVVQEAANQLKDGKITNEEYRATVSENSPIMPITRFFEPATEQRIREAVSSDKIDKVNSPVEEGTIVGLRLDIPAYQNKNTWVVSVHEGDKDNGKAISYLNVGKIKNVKFGVKPKGALGIATGKEKQTIGRMFGAWENIPGDTLEQKGENAKKIVEEIVNDPSWVQVGMNPFRHSYFYDRSSDIGRPVRSASEVIQVGGLVYAKDVEYGNWDDADYKVTGLLDAAGKGVSFSRSTTGPGNRSTGTASNLRGTIERVAGTLDESVRQEIEANPEAYIDPLKINEAKAKFSTMTDQDLIQYLSNSGMRILSNDPESNIGLLAKIEIIKRAQNSPDQKFDGVPLSSLIIDAAKLGSIGGRILRMMRELNVITPSTYSDIVIRMIENTGAVLSEDNKASIRLLATDVVSTGNQTSVAKQNFEQDPSRANQIALMSARKAEQEAIDALSRYIEPKMPVDLAKSFISNMQGNLLNVQSLGINLTSTTVGSGILFLPKAVAKTAISIINKGVAAAFKINNKNIAEVGYLLGLKHYVKGFAPALSKAWGILRNGTDAEIDAAKGVIRQSIKPSVMLDMLFNSKEYARRVKGKKEYSYRMVNGKFEVFDVNNPGKTLYTFAYEDAAKQMAFEKSNPIDRAQTLKYITKTVTGLAPEAMFRIMAATDTLIREPNQAYINAMFGARLGLKGEDLASFVFDPGKDYADYLKYQGAKSVFQEDRRGTQIITNALRELEKSSDSNAFASAANVVVRTSIPYVKTPANIVTQYMNYALPFIPMYRSMQKYAQAGTETSEAKKRILMDEAEDAMAVAFVGFGLWAAFTTLAISKLITAGYDHYDDDEKAMMTKIGVPFSAINITALKRMMDGGSIEPQPGDEYVALKYFGLPGMIAQMHGNRIQKEFNDAKKEGKVFNGDLDESMTAKFFEMFSVSDVMGTAFDQSFAAGINTLFGVMRDPESKTTYAAKGYAQSIVAGLGIPATFSKAMETEYIPNLTDKSSAVKTFRNVFMYRMAGITDGVPSKIDVFGRKLAPYTPEGADPMIYNTFYPFKINKSSGSSVDYTLYKVMVETKDPGVIPSMYKQQDIMDGLKSLEVSGFRPSPADVEALNIDRGQRRLQYLTETMNGDFFAYIQDGELVEVDSFDKLPAKDKAYHIKKAYKNADAEHIKEFRNDYITKIAQGLGAKFKPDEEFEETETEE